MKDSFGARQRLQVGDRAYDIYRLDALSGIGEIARLPYALRILLENLLRHEDSASVTADDIRALAGWKGGAPPPDREIAFTPARTLLQDFTGVPAIVDLAAMRDAMAALGGDPSKIDPLQPVELVIDHSVQVDAFNTPTALADNEALDYARNEERYAFLKWGQQAFDNFKVVPPNTGICHQVNLEFLSRVVFTSDENPKAPQGARPLAYPDTLVGTDSHTPMVNGLGVLGWGVGGIEAEAAMLGQPLSMLIPEVIGFRLVGALREGATATDLVLTVCEMLRKKGVVGKFVEFYGPGVAAVPLADRATIGNMSPEYGATCAIFPVDEVTLAYLRFTGRPPERVALVEAYMKAQGLFYTKDGPEPVYTDTLELDLSTVEPSIAGPKRPQDRIPLGQARQAFADALPALLPGAHRTEGVKVTLDGHTSTLHHGSVVIAAITSCTNTSNPSVMLAAGLLAKKAVQRGLTRRPWVKTSLAPGSKVVTEYYDKAGLTTYLDQLGFQLVGYGCTTCIGNSGPLPPAISQAITDGELVACSVLSGNRNFEGRIHPEVRANYLMSPPLVVAYALVGRMDVDLRSDPLGTDQDGKPVYLKDIWPSSAEVDAAVRDAVASDMFRRTYGDVYAGDERWEDLPAPTGDRFAWDDASTYVRQPPYFEGMSREAPERVDDIRGARCVALLGDSVTTDHISPAGNIKRDSPAGKYLMGKGVQSADFNSYGARRGNHEVMIRGTFANVRIRNQLVPGVEGGFSVHLPSGDRDTLFDVAMRYQQDGTPLVVLAGKEYGSGSSRDWAAKGPFLQGIRAVVAESFERIHRSNLVGMGILPLQFAPDESVASLGLDGTEVFDIEGITERVADQLRGGREVTVIARKDDQEKRFQALVRIDTPQEVAYYRHGGILQYVLRQLLDNPSEPMKAGGISSTPSVPDRQPDEDQIDEAGEESFPGSDPPTF